MGSQNKCDMHLVLHRLVTLIQDGLLETGKQDWVHYLGTSKLEWAIAFTQIQRAIRQHHNPNFTISYDCASPFLATANGQVYHENRLLDDGKWSYKMTKCVDDKKYARDSRLFRDAIMQDMPDKWPSFMDSPIMQRTQIQDVCHYAPGELNKIGKEGKTSWDSFSYAILMAHNIYCHIDAVQQGNRLFDQGCIPRMLKEKNDPRRAATKVVKPPQFDSLITLEQTPYHDRFFKHLVTDLFTAKTRDQSNRILKEYNQWFTKVYGSSANGMLGPKAINSITAYHETFGDQLKQIEHSRDDSGLSEKSLNQLESELQKEQ
jgi:hypothetical protein